MTNTCDYLLERGDANSIAVIDEGEAITFDELRRVTILEARILLSKGVRPTDRVSLIAGNSFFWISSYLAILKIGGVAVPFPPSIRPKELALLIQRTTCRGACIEQRLLQKFGPVLGSIPLVLDNIDTLSTQTPLDLNQESDLSMEAQEALLMGTSGSTAAPRFVRISHRNIQANTDSIIRSLDLTSADRIMAVLPFYYCFGTSLLHTHLRVGGSLVVSNSFAYPEIVLDLMQDYRCTGFAGVPSTYQTLIRDSTLPKRQFDNLRKIQQAGGRLAPILIQELAAILPKREIFIMYGQTEATARLSYLPPAFLNSKMGSIGRGIPGVELKVQTVSGIEVQPGEVGEVVARGDNIARGYLDDPEETAAKFVGDTLRTGDLATVDSDGFIYIVDRVSDFIKSYGHRVSSQQIEACVMELPYVVSAAAIGRPDLVKGEAIIVYCKLRADTKISETEVISHCKHYLPSYMVPAGILIIENMPINASGKICKSALRQIDSDNIMPEAKITVTGTIEHS